MRIRRLGWVGLDIEQDGGTLLIDYIQDTAELPLCDADQPFPKPSSSARVVAGLLTHLHADHADPVALAEALGPEAPVFRPAPDQGFGTDLELTAHAEAAFGQVS